MCGLGRVRHVAGSCGKGGEGDGGGSLRSGKFEAGDELGGGGCADGFLLLLLLMLGSGLVWSGLVGIVVLDGGRRR